MITQMAKEEVTLRIRKMITQMAKEEVTLRIRKMITQMAKEEVTQEIIRQHPYLKKTLRHPSVQM